LRTERDRRPVLPAPQRRTELDFLAHARFVRQIDFRTSSLRIEALEHVLLHVGTAVDEVNRAVRPFEKPEVAVARDVNEAFYRLAVAWVVDEVWRRHFVPVPRVVGVVLGIALDGACRDVDRERRTRVEIVAGPQFADPWTAVASAPVREVRLRVVVCGD